MNDENCSWKGCVQAETGGGDWWPRLSLPACDDRWPTSVRPRSASATPTTKGGQRAEPASNRPLSSRAAILCSVKPPCHGWPVSRRPRLSR